MITVETVVAYALRNNVVMDALGEALRSNLVIAHPFQRQLAEFADDFLGRYHKLPASGDWDVWLDSLPDVQGDGCRETLQNLQRVDTSQFHDEHFATTVLPTLKQAATKTAVSRLNSLVTYTPETFRELASEIEAIGTRSISGLANLRDVRTWFSTAREDDLIPTGFHTLDSYIGGWGKELWLLFADSKMGKTMWMQNAVTNVALRGKRVLHVSLELGLRNQILRYYRQLAQATMADFIANPVEVKRRLAHWFRLSAGQVYLLEFPAYSLTTDELKRIIDRVNRTMDAPIDVLALDYLDLMAPPKGVRGRGDEILGHITHDLRSCCPMFDIAALTVSQAIRNPKHKDRLTMKDIGDSYKKVQGVDGLMSLVQTVEEEEMHQGRMGLLAVRDAGGRGLEIQMYVNRELSVIQELDHINTIELRHGLGHCDVGSCPWCLKGVPKGTRISNLPTVVYP